jgi:PadR family transcriptional regulator, regulatory protein PadR
MGRSPRLTVPTLKVLNSLIASSTELSGADLIRTCHLPSGTLYPILIRLEEYGWVKSRWEDLDPSEAGRPRRRLYTITKVGAANAAAATKEVVGPLGARSWA